MTPARREQHPPTALAHYAPGTDGERERRQAELCDLAGDVAGAARLRRESRRLAAMRTDVRVSNQTLTPTPDCA